VAFVQEPTRRRTGLYGLAVLVLAVLAVVVVAVGGGKTKSSSPSGSDSKPATSTELRSEDVTYGDVYGAQIPSSGAGPRQTSNGRALGFERSRAGAVLAAINIFARSESRPGPGVFEPTIKEQVVGPDKDKLLANVQRSYGERVAQGMVPDSNGVLTAAVENARTNQSKLWAYRIDAYDDASASVNLVLRSFSSGTPSYVNFALTVRWSDGDWRLVAPLNGEFASAGQQMTEVPEAYILLGKA
jgi:hypothetical protein